MPGDGSGYGLWDTGSSFRLDSTLTLTQPLDVAVYCRGEGIDQEGYPDSPNIEYGSILIETARLEAEVPSYIPTGASG